MIGFRVFYVVGPYAIQSAVYVPLVVINEEPLVIVKTKGVNVKPVVDLFEIQGIYRCVPSPIGHENVIFGVTENALANVTVDDAPVPVTVPDWIILILLQLTLPKFTSVFDALEDNGVINVDNKQVELFAGGVGDVFWVLVVQEQIVEYVTV